MCNLQDFIVLKFVNKMNYEMSDCHYKIPPLLAPDGSFLAFDFRISRFLRERREAFSQAFSSQLKLHPLRGTPLK